MCDENLHFTSQALPQTGSNAYSSSPASVEAQPSTSRVPLPRQSAVQLPSFVFEKSSTSRIPRKKRNVELLTEVAIRKSCRRGSESRYNFGSTTVPKRRNDQKKRKTSAPTSTNSTITTLSTSSAIESCAEGSLQMQTDLSEQMNQDYFLSDTFDHQAMVHDSSSDACTLDKVDAYVHQLLTHKAFVPCDHKFQAFAIQDIQDLSNEINLKPHSYHFVQRYGRCFHLSDVKWIYSCTCDVNRTRLVSSLSAVVDCSYDDLCKMPEFAECIHIQAAVIITIQLDAIHYVTPSIEFMDHSYGLGPVENPFELLRDITKIGTSNTTVCVNTNGSYAVVYISAKQIITCSSCHKNQTSCKHVNCLLSVIESCSNTQEDLPNALELFADLVHSKDLESTTSDVHTFQPSHTSRKSIPFCLPESLTKVTSLPYLERFNLVDNVAHLIPTDTDTHCPKCVQAMWTSDVYFDHNATIVTNNQLFKAKVYKRRCTSLDCDGELIYDGQEQCLLVMNQHLFAYEVLRRFMFQFLIGRTTIFTEHSVLIMIHKDAGNTSFSKMVSYNHFRLAWYTFLELMSADMNFSDGFLCSHCGSYPSIIIMDATSLAFRQDLDFWGDAPLPEYDMSKKDTIPKGSFSDRVFISDRRTRQLITQYATKGLPQNDMLQLRELACEHAACLVKLFKFLAECSPQDHPAIQCPLAWRKLIQGLASSSPVCALLPPDDTCINLVKQMKEGDITKDPNAMNQLQNASPILFDLLLSVEKYPHQLMSPILDKLIEKATNPFRDDHSEANDSVSCKKQQLGNSDGCVEKSLSYFPSLPQVRARRRYEADKNNKERICTKKGIGHPSLLPGIFTIFCEHGICYGFQVMRMHESPNTPFSVLYERFEKIPQVIIYDNSCNLHSYCLNREPMCFKHTRFVVDKFHWPNHTGCSKAYDMRLYPQLARINSQIVEQSNAALKRIKPSVSYMNSKHFMSHCIFYLWYRNRSL